MRPSDGFFTHLGTLLSATLGRAGDWADRDHTTDHADTRGCDAVSPHTHDEPDEILVAS